MSSRGKAKTGGQSIPANMREKHDAIMALVEPFGRAHLNDEYLGLCRRLAAMLARKRPSPMVNGTAAVWACGIVRAVGWANFLDDPSQKPHMKTADIDKAFGVSTASGQARSKAIRDLLKINRMDPEWTLPSKLGDNPLVWMVQVNGLLFDARYLPRQIQEEAFERGLIPYIPDEGGGGNWPPDTRR